MNVKVVPDPYEQNQPAVFDGELYYPIGYVVRPANRGAVSAMNRALHDLANPLPPPITSTFSVLSWLRERRRSLGVALRWKRAQWQNLRLGLGCRIGSWIAGEDVR